MRAILENILINKNDSNYNDFINITFWLLFYGKNNLKFVLSIFLIIENYKNIIFLLFQLVFTMIKFLLVGIKNIKLFNKSALKRTNFLIMMAIISKKNKNLYYNYILKP